MKLKKILCIVFAVLFVAAASAIAIHAAEMSDHKPSCTRPNVVEVLTYHDIIGSRQGCYATIWKYCKNCGADIDIWDASFTPCPHSEGEIGVE